MRNKLIEFLTIPDQPSFGECGKVLPLWKSILYDFVYLLTFGFCRIF